ncbi:MAG TPA: hypothetical protein DER01_05150 [Phycisphaerales bacterium]|nr:hypothetical protein [Phycisphaerales bacterium]|tara:strand:- start:3028 stop:3753 length:726 start_codon:yes stop_codon:yes gene_type:complete
MSETNKQNPSPQTQSIPKPPLKFRLFIWLVGFVLSLAYVYTVAWFGYRANPDMQGTYTNKLQWKFDHVVSNAKSYHKKFGKYPATIRHLILEHEPEKTLDEEYIQIADHLIKNMATDPWGNAIQYEKKDETTIILHSFGRDGKPGGIGSDSDIYMDDEPGIKTMPTFKQMLFDIDTSPGLFKASLILGIISIFAFQLQLSRKSVSYSWKHIAFNFVILLPCCAMIAVWQIAGYLISANQTH